MDFGRVKNFDELNLGLNADHKSVIKVLGGIKAAQPKVFVGGVLWSDESFKGSIYPAKAKPADFVKYYTKQFNTIELNLTHYRTPGIDTVKRWYDLSPEGFRFCPKVHQDVSHAPNLLSRVSYHNECGALYNTLKGKCGMQFLQLPPHFDPARLNELLEFLDKSDVRNLAVELRHPAWFTGSEEMNALCNYLYKNTMSLVLSDTPGRRDVLHMRLTNKTAFVRFNANDNHPTDKVRIDDWVNRLKTWFDNGLETLYFFVHSPQQIHMPHLVTYFIQQLQRVAGIKLTPPVIKSQGPEKNTLF